VASDTNLQPVTHPTMHAEQFDYAPYPQLDGEKENNEGVCRNYPHPAPVAIEDLSSEDKEILQSVSPVPEEGMQEEAVTVSSPHLAPIHSELTLACACAPIRPTRSYKEVAPVSRNAVERRADTRPSLMKRGFHYHRPRAWSSAARARACS